MLMQIGLLIKNSPNLLCTLSGMDSESRYTQKLPTNNNKWIMARINQENKMVLSQNIKYFYFRFIYLFLFLFFVSFFLSSLLSALRYFKFHFLFLFLFLFLLTFLVLQILSDVIVHSCVSQIRHWLFLHICVFNYIFVYSQA